MVPRTAALLLIPLFLILLQPLDAQEEKTAAGNAEKAATVTSESLKISRETGRLEYTGNVRLTKGNVILSSDKMSYNRKEQIAYAEGHVLLLRGEFSIACDKMTYNVGKDTGVAEFVSSYSHSWYGWGKEIIRVSKDEYLVKDGYITTDPYPRPGWRIKARRIRIFPGNKIIARHITMYIGNVPVLYLPYYRVSLKDKDSPLSVEVGRTDPWGTYILVAYDLLISEGVHTIFHLDYRSEKKWAEGIDLITYQKNGGYTESRFYFANDKNWLQEIDGEEISVEDERYQVDLKGYQPFRNTWDIRYELHKFSDEDFLKDFFRKEFDKDSQPETFINLSKYNPNWTFNAFARKQTNDFYTTTERLPDLSIEYANRRIGRTPFYHDGSDSLVYLNQVDRDDTIPEYDAVRADFHHRISYPRKYFGWLNIVPRVGVRGTHYNDSPDGDTRTRHVINTDIDFFTKIFKLWDHEDPEKNIHGLRHIIEPNIHYFYTPEPNVEPIELFQFDRVDGLDEVNRFRLGVRNKLQTRRYGGTWDLIDLDTFVDYYPDLDIIEGDRRFSDVHFDLELFPTRNFKIDMDASVDTYDEEISSFNTQLSYYRSDTFGVNFEYRYRVDDSNLFATEGYLKLSYEYAVKAYLRYEAETSEFEEAEITVFKDLRTWVGALSFRHREEEDENQIWLSFYLKGLPNSPLLGGN